VPRKVQIALEIIRAARKAGLDLRVERNRSSLSVNDTLTVNGVRLNLLVVVDNALTSNRMNWTPSRLHYKRRLIMWAPFEEAEPIHQGTVEEHAANLAKSLNQPFDRVLEIVKDEMQQKFYKNNCYTVIVRRLQKKVGSEALPDLLWLSIRRNDREPIRDWRDLQRIKNEIVGPRMKASNCSRRIAARGQQQPVPPIRLCGPDTSVVLWLPGSICPGSRRRARIGVEHQTAST